MALITSARGQRHHRCMLNIHGQPAADRMETLYALHPWGTPPSGTPGTGVWLLENPGRFEPTSRWLSFLATCQRLAANHPDNPRALAYVKAVEEVLAWRAALPEPLHFWGEDPPINLPVLPTNPAVQAAT